ncbi:MAG: lysine-2,3-aminomutase-like protein [Alphaproteobacteria bacterium]|nr:lysine-2,3-aminomutase-like protein [Alphaproteobacteria bacterium]MBV8549559.1 lysine-2,3-aminomutase-like protein [Alphaproteobacteria bacterium]
MTSSPEHFHTLETTAASFGVAITPALRAAMDINDPHDPIAKQFMPSVHEAFIHDDELSDPIGDFAHNPTEGLVHRYPDRVLLKIASSCAVNCRYCFRRDELTTPKPPLSPEALQKAFDYIRTHEEVWEVILTGGDPLVLSDRQLKFIIDTLNDIDHVKIIRIHTRLPVANPTRITRELVAALRGAKPVYVVLHCNSARELTDDARAACARLIDAGMPMLAQSVLLRGVNDTTASLTALLRALVETRIKPYQIYHGDLARGTSHFRVALQKGRDLIGSLRGVISGLCQPTYLMDIPGGYGKILLTPASATPKGDGWELTDRHGNKHDYHDALITTDSDKTAP